MVSAVRTRVKICGITTVADGLAAVAAGVDAVGLVFAAGSPRAVTVELAAEIRRQLPPFVVAVGLFVNPEPLLVTQAQDQAQLDLLQFHGDETADFCKAFNRPFIKAMRATEVADWPLFERQYGAASGLLVDSGAPGVPGGTGVTFDWSLLPKGLEKPLILAGGLSPQNVGLAIADHHPYGVDVSSGVEQSPGIKDWSKMSEFVRAVEKADRSRG